jgi:hypothetical protein
MPTGPFTCEFTVQRSGGPAFVREENGFGEGPYAGHAFSMGGQLTREGDAPPRVQGRGQID